MEHCLLSFQNFKSYQIDILKITNENNINACFDIFTGAYENAYIGTKSKFIKFISLPQK